MRRKNRLPHKHQHAAEIVIVVNMLTNFKTIKMENEKNTKQDCGCGDSCCAPSKSKLWMKIVFIAIVVAALAIVAVKLINGGADTTAKKSSCCDSTKTKTCDKDTKSPCCSKSNDSKETTEKSTCGDNTKSKESDPGKSQSSCTKSKAAAVTTEKSSCCDTTKTKAGADKSHSCCSDPK